MQKANGERQTTKGWGQPVRPQRPGLGLGPQGTGGQPVRPTGARRDPRWRGGQPVRPTGWRLGPQAATLDRMHRNQPQNTPPGRTEGSLKGGPWFM